MKRPATTLSALVIVLAAALCAADEVTSLSMSLEAELVRAGMGNMAPDIKDIVSNLVKEQMTRECARAKTMGATVMSNSTSIGELANPAAEVAKLKAENAQLKAKLKAKLLPGPFQGSKQPSRDTTTLDGAPEQALAKGSGRRRRYTSTSSATRSAGNVIAGGFASTAAA